MVNLSVSARLARAALAFLSVMTGGVNLGLLSRGIIILNSVNNSESMSLAAISSSVLLVELLAVSHLEGVLAVVSAAESGGIFLATSVDSDLVSSLVGSSADFNSIGLSTFRESSLPRTVLESSG